MEKRGQFYLVAAIIIVLAISGVMSIATYATVKPSPKTINNLGSDLEKEGSRIVDYGIYSDQDVRSILDDFTTSEFAPYFLKKTDNANVVFIYGNSSTQAGVRYTNLTGVRYSTVSTGTVTASIGGAVHWDTVGAYANRTAIIDDNGDGKVDVTILGKTFNFTLKDGEMFYFVMLEERDGEIYVQENID